MEYINALRAGTRLEEYEVRDVLGQGGFGITYLAEDTNLGKQVALKEYLPRDFATRTASSTVVPNSSADATDYRWGLDRFLDEARTLARFDHPHLNKVHRFFEANGTACLVLEYIDGQTLSALLNKYPTVPDAHLRRIIAEVLSGLEEVHRAGYVHRDIKPSNIMLRRDGSAVLLDFGAARQAVGQRSKSITSILTPGYAPIEQYDTKAADVGPWSDLYALGMVAYRCISGGSDADLPDAVTRARAQRKGGQDLTPAAEVGKGVYDAQFLQAIDWATQVNEEERPQSIAAWQEALSDGRGMEERGSSDKERKDDQGEEATRRKSRFRRLSRLALATVAVGGLGAVLWRTVPVSDIADIVSQFISEDRSAPSQERTETAVTDPPSVVSPDPAPEEAAAHGGAAVDWGRARATDTEAAYREFLARYPDDPLTILAEARLAEVEKEGEPPVAETQPDLSANAAADWDRAQAVDTAAAYREFLARYPDDPLAKLAELKLSRME